MVGGERGPMGWPAVKSLAVVAGVVLLTVIAYNTAWIDVTLPPTFIPGVPGVTPPEIIYPRYREYRNWLTGRHVACARAGCLDIKGSKWADVLLVSLGTIALVIGAVWLLAPRGGAAMGFWKNVKGIWDSKARAESVIETQVQSFAAFRLHYPDRDPNAWLALTLQARQLHPLWRGKPDFWYYTETALFSVLSVEEAPVALGLYILWKEEPGLGVQYEEVYRRIMAPVFALKQAGTFTQRWRQVNPWTATHFPSVAQGLADAEGPPPPSPPPPHGSQERR